MFLVHLIGVLVNTLELELFTPSFFHWSNILNQVLWMELESEDPFIFGYYNFMLATITASDRDETFGDTHHVVRVEFVHFNFECLILRKFIHVWKFT